MGCIREGGRFYALTEKAMALREVVFSRYDVCTQVEKAFEVEVKW